MAGSAVLLGLVAVITCLGTVQPRLTERMRHSGTMAVMAGFRVRFTAIGLGQVMALVARVDVRIECLVVVVVSVLPARSNGRLAARSTEVALAAAYGQVVTGSAILLGLVAVVVRLITVQPHLASGVGFNFMAVVTTDRSVAVRPIQGVTLVAGVFLIFVALMTIVVSVLPSGTERGLAA